MPNYRFIVREVERGSENETEFTKRLPRPPTLAQARTIGRAHVPAGRHARDFDLTVIPSVLLRAAYQSDDMEIPEYERIARKYGRNVFGPMGAALFYCVALS